MTRYQEILKAFKLELECRKYAQSTIDTYCSCLCVFMRAMNGKTKPLHTDEIKKFLCGVKNRNYHKQFVATIQHLYRLVLKQPISLADIPYPRPSSFLPEIFSLQEVHRLIESYANLKHRAMMQIMYSCALRIGEVVKIEITHVQSDRAVIRISGAKGFKDRDVPIPIATLELLRAYYQAERPRPCKWLFEGWGHQQYSVRSIQQVFYQGCRRIGISRHVTPHSLRHSRATHLHDANVDIKDISDFLGHSQIKTTAEFYLKLSKKTLSARIIAADDILSRTLTPQYQLSA